jgi:DNA polymerase
MDPARRTTYLKALGVDVWTPRSAAVNAVRAPSVEPSLSYTAPAMPAVESVQIQEAPVPMAARTPKVPAPAAKPALPPITVPADWSGLRDMVQACRRCKLCETRTQTVFGTGAQGAPLMVVGEAPGADEDAQGDPFVGRAGKLLDEMLASIGRSRRENVYIANTVKCRPPGNRDPEVDEVEACRPYLDQQIDLVKPRLIVALGRVAAQRLLATDVPLARLRGPVHHYGQAQTPLLITYHPAYLLRSPREKAKSWEDLKKVWRLLGA